MEEQPEEPQVNYDIWEKRFLESYDDGEILRSRLLKAQQKVSDCYLKEGVNHALKCKKEVEHLASVMYETHDYEWRHMVDHHAKIRNIAPEKDSAWKRDQPNLRWILERPGERL